MRYKNMTFKMMDYYYYYSFYGQKDELLKLYINFEELFTRGKVD